MEPSTKITPVKCGQSLPGLQQHHKGDTPKTMPSRRSRYQERCHHPSKKDVVFTERELAKKGERHSCYDPFVAHQLSNHHIGIASVWPPPNHAPVPLRQPTFELAAKPCRQLAATHRSSPENWLRPPPSRHPPASSPCSAKGEPPPELPPLTSSHLNPTETPHKEGEELKKGEGAD
uniref:Uncharacterized protein n=1 Tax=Oryza punctata TaxID=4537 RepID=A0A0E0MJ31_ORYPU